MPTRIIDGKLVTLSKKNLLIEIPHMPICVETTEDLLRVTYTNPDEPEEKVDRFGTFIYYYLPDGRFYNIQKYKRAGSIITQGCVLSKEEMVNEIEAFNLDADNFLPYLGDLPTF